MHSNKRGLDIFLNVVVVHRLIEMLFECLFVSKE